MKNSKPPSINRYVETDSCLAEKLQALTEITKDQAVLLESLEKEKRSLEPGEEVFKAGKPPNHLFILRKGWLLSERFSADGTRSVVRVHHPGDIVGASHIPYEATPYRGVARTEAVICPFPRSNLANILNSSPRLSALLLCIAMIESAEQEDRASVFRRNSAVAKLALFAQQTLGRLKLMNRLLHDQFHCPLNQTDIADVVGMTSVHVSRTFSKMESDGILKRNGTFIQIIDDEKLAAQSGYINRYKQLDLSWLPEL